MSVKQCLLNFLAASVVCTGCHHKAPTGLDLDQAACGQSIVAALGDTIRLSVGTVGPGSFGLPVGSGTTLTFIRSFAAPPYTPGGLHQQFVFLAAASGTADITIPGPKTA